MTVCFIIRAIDDKSFYTSIHLFKGFFAIIMYDNKGLFWLSKLVSFHGIKIPSVRVTFLLAEKSVCSLKEKCSSESTFEKKH